MDNYEFVINRLCQEIDHCIDRIDKVVETVHKQSGYMRVYGRITICIIIALLGLSFMIFQEFGKSRVDFEKPQRVEKTVAEVKKNGT